MEDIAVRHCLQPIVAKHADRQEASSAVASIFIERSFGVGQIRFMSARFIDTAMA
ncbi:MAG: hypothetical protein R2788_22595 [Saprospiraceae bacterium]